MTTPELEAAVKRLARTIRSEFAPAQFLAGCEVKSIADINEYATNNGWIEALCAEHNQQRVRYKAFPANVAVGDDLDVIYYPQHKFFEVYGGGGASATGANNAFVSKVYEPDLSASALAADNSGDITISGNVIMSGTVKAIEGSGNSKPDLGDSADSTKRWGSIYQAGGEGYFADGDITFSVQDAWNLKSTPGTWLKFDGAAGAHAILPQNTTTPDLGSTTAAEKFGNIYLASGKFASADNFAFIVKNTSGAAATANDVGYIDDAGEYKTTTTANDDVLWCVVIIGGANNADIYVTRRGRVTVAYAGSAPAPGDFLVTSTTAGSAQAQTTMRPEIFAVCLAAGGGGTVSALLLCHRKTQIYTSGNDTIFVNGANDSDFVSTIAAAGVSGDKVYYGTVTSGNVNCITPASSSEDAKIILHNTTRTEEARIIATGTDGGGNFIQVSAAGDVAAWVATDAITARSQTNTSVIGSSYFFDIEVTSALPTLTAKFTMSTTVRDTGAVGKRLFSHPYETNAGSKRLSTDPLSTAIGTKSNHDIPMISSRFCIAFEASGAGTMKTQNRIREVILATP